MKTLQNDKKHYNNILIKILKKREIILDIKKTNRAKFIIIFVGLIFINKK